MAQKITLYLISGPSKEVEIFCAPRSNGPVGGFHLPYKPSTSIHNFMA